MHNNHKVHGKTFVVFGGDVQIINAIERMLLFAGSSVHAYSNSQAGVSAAETVHPDIVILEATDNDISPATVIEKLERSSATAAIPLLIIADEAEAEALRALCSTIKPEFISRSGFDVMQLILQIESTLQDSPVLTQSTVFDFSESDKNVIKTVGQHTLRLLVVEDDSLLRNLLSIRLSKSQIQYDFCHSGLDAVAKVLEYKPTIVLLDLMLPGKNGIEVLTELRALPEVATTPVIIFSNKDDDAERAKAAALGVTNFLVKATTDLSTLIDLIIEKGKTD